MAILQGIKERVHLPLYDSLFVRPRQQLRQVESSSVLKFFVNVQGKTKLETNMQTSALLPHWNTFEARALRVVISDLLPSFPDPIRSCIRESVDTDDRGLKDLIMGCLDQLSALIKDEKQAADGLPAGTIRRCADTARTVAERAGGFDGGLETCLEILATICSTPTLGTILERHRQLRQLRSDLAELIKRSRIPIQKPKWLREFGAGLAELADIEEEQPLLQKITYLPQCVDVFGRLVELLRLVQSISVEEVRACRSSIEELLAAIGARLARLEEVRQCLTDIVKDCGPPRQSAPRLPWALLRCLREHLPDESLAPIEEQLFGPTAEILSKLIYNSVTTLFVGEKMMIQMPTWFFPSGGGPYSEDGQVVTHGVPSPQATFRFAEPVFIDTKQNFRVEIEIPEAGALGELQRLYGPFFIWVVLDGYRTRDVQ